MGDIVALYDMYMYDLASNRGPDVHELIFRSRAANPDQSPVPDISWLARVADSA